MLVLLLHPEALDRLEPSFSIFPKPLIIILSPLISSFGEISVSFSISTIGISFRTAFVEVFDSTFGHAGAFVSAPSRSINSDTEVLLSFAAVVRLHSVIENPGPFKEVSNTSEYIFVGLISHFDSMRMSIFCYQVIVVTADLVEPRSLE